MATRGIHVIWTTYGTWLPGDARGHWSPLYDLYGRLRVPGDQLNSPDTHTRRVAFERMKEQEKVLNATEIQIVAETIGAEVTNGDPEMRGSIMAVAIEPTHVHLLLEPIQEHIGKIVGRLKGSTSSSILKLPENMGRTRTWTSNYWKVFLFDSAALYAIRTYIVEHNLRRGLQADPYDWITPI